MTKSLFIVVLFFIYFQTAGQDSLYINIDSPKNKSTIYFNTNCYDIQLTKQWVKKNKKFFNRNLMQSIKHSIYSHDSIWVEKYLKKKQTHSFYRCILNGLKQGKWHVLNTKTQQEVQHIIYSRKMIDYIIYETITDQQTGETIFEYSYGFIGCPAF